MPRRLTRLFGGLVRHGISMALRIPLRERPAFGTCGTSWWSGLVLNGSRRLRTSASISGRNPGTN